VSSLPNKNMFEIFSQGLFEGVKPMMVIRDHLVRHPDRCMHNGSVSYLSDQRLALDTTLQVRPLPLPRKLPPLPRCVPVASDLRGIQEG